MTTWLWGDDRFLPCSGVPLSDRGFRYGMSVFESLRVREGKAEFPAEHLARLEAACALVGFPKPQLTATDFSVVEGDGFARIHVTAGEGGPGDETTSCQVYLTFEQRAAETRDAFDVSVHRGWETPLFPGLKTGNYWPHIAALQTAQQQNCDEALLLKHDGRLVSAAMANVFVVREGRVLTPPLSDGARDGVVREWVMQRIEVEEAHLREDELKQAGEIFLTNSWIGIMPVASLEGRELPSRALASELQRAC